MKHFSIIFVFVVLFALVSISTAQIEWIKNPNNPVLSGGAAGTWNRHVFFPCVLYNPDSSRYEMWFTASTGPGAPNWRPYRIGFATSPDGTSWTMYPDPVLEPDAGSWDETTVDHATVLRENGEYKMWYTGWSPTSPEFKIGFATSPNGIDWTKDTLHNPIMGSGNAAWEDGGVGYCTVMHEQGGEYKMWYGGLNKTWVPDSGRTGYATSSDGITWQRDTLNNPVLTTGSSGEWDDAMAFATQVLFISDLYYMWYGGNRINWNPRQTGLATSTNGIDWIKYDDPTTSTHPYAESDPVLSPSPGQWDGNYAEAATVLLIEDTLHMWYDGSREPQSTYLWRIGHATAPVSIIPVPNQYATIQEAIDAVEDGKVILVDEGIYYENIDFKGKAITVASHFWFDGDTSHISNTIIDGSQSADLDSGSVVYMVSGEDTTSVLMGLTITNGSGTKIQYTYQNTVYDARAGGGIYCWNSGGRFVWNKIMNNTISTENQAVGGGLGTVCFGSNPDIILENNQIKNNTINGPLISTGGGISISSDGKIIDNNISYNSCISTGKEAAGGGVRIAAEQNFPRTVLIKNNKITHNLAKGKGIEAPWYLGALGGGLFNAYSKVFVYDNNISYNQLSEQSSSSASGGGIYMYLADGACVVSRNMISRNTVDVTRTNYGGGISMATCNFPVYNNIIFGNTADRGGGIYLLNTTPEIINNTIVNNEGTYRGGGLYSDNANPIILNTIIYGNIDPVSSQIYGTARVRYSDIQGGANGLGNIDADPLLHDSLMASNDTMFCCLAANSPCIDAGNPDTSSYDIEDPQNPGYALWPAMETLRNDMGAYGGHGSTDIIVGIKKSDDKSQALNTYQLSQNYPNPFNPSTTIEFALPKTSEVTLKIFNILGEEVAKLVSDRLTSGTYSYVWDASNMASGIYLYRLSAGSLTTKSGHYAVGEAGEFVVTKKMVLMR